MTPYMLAKKVILTHKKSEDYVYNLVDVYFASGRLTNEEYGELIELIKTEYEENEDK